MVKADAQLYTMEGIAAGLIMLLTTYLVLGSTSVYTPGDTHLTDMQLEQVGSDVLKLMDTPVNLTTNSTLRTILENTDGVSFNGNFTVDFNNPNIVATATSFGSSRIRIKATVWYRNQTSNGIQSYNLFTSGGVAGNPSAEGPGVRVSRLVHLSVRPDSLRTVDPAAWNSMRPGPQEVLVEVLVWQV
jgi:hypothetical protein